MKRRLDPSTEDGIKAAVRLAFAKEEECRDREFEEQVKRLLGHLDRFTGGSGGRADA